MDLVRDIAERSGLESRISFDGPIDSGVDSEVVPDLLAVLREALSNTARHARASSVAVHLSVHRAIELRVRDDGIGIPDRVQHRSGLANLAHRATALDGTFRVEPNAGGGTTLVWRVPLTRGPSARPSGAS
jgi:signal transduction histidine kinase